MSDVQTIKPEEAQSSTIVVETEEAEAVSIVQWDSSKVHSLIIIFKKNMFCVKLNKKCSSPKLNKLLDVVYS